MFLYLLRVFCGGTLRCLVCPDYCKQMVLLTAKRNSQESQPLEATVAGTVAAVLRVRTLCHNSFVSHDTSVLRLIPYLGDMNTSPARRFCCGVGSLDNDSDEDPEVEMSAISTPRGTRVTHHAFPSKRRKMNPAGEEAAKLFPNVVSTGPETTADDQAPGEVNPTEEKKRNQARVSCFSKVVE